MMPAPRQHSFAQMALSKITPHPGLWWDDGSLFSADGGCVIRWLAQDCELWSYALAGTLWVRGDRGLARTPSGRRPCNGRRFLV
jgi:hypothetical protein